jgi:hypothetical protein
MWHAWERGEKCTGFWRESPKEKDHLKDQGRDGRMGSKWTLGRLVGVGGVEWIHVAQDRDHWQAVVNAVMNLWLLAPQSELYITFYSTQKLVIASFIFSTSLLLTDTFYLNHV